MKKSLIALAVAGAFVAPVAMADVTIYGQANVSLDFTNNGNGANGTNGTGATKVTSNNSRIGFKGSEDLGDGVSAIWQFENQWATDVGGFNGVRDSFAGLSSGSMGTLIAGVHDTPYKMATRGFDLFGDGIADNRSIMGATGGGAVNHDARLGNVIAYIAPAFSGVTLAGAYVAAAENATLSGQSKASAYSLAALYGDGPIKASFGYQNISGGAANSSVAPAALLVSGNSATAWKIGGGYSADAFTINAVYERTSSSIGGADVLGQNNFYLGGKFNVSANDAVKAAYAKAGQVGSPSAANSGAKQFSIGYDHNMSKRTTVYALYTKLTNDSAASYTLGGTTTGPVTSAGVGAGANPSAFSLGLKHSF